MKNLASFIMWTVLIVGGLVGLARGVALRWWQVPSEEDDPTLAASITPTLGGGDWVILWRLTSAKHGDLVKCAHPTEEGIVMGRLVGEEGEKVKVTGATVHLNNRLQQTERACDPPTVAVTGPGLLEEVTQPCSLEVIGGQSHKAARIPQGGSVMAPRDFELSAGPGEVVLVSDNRLFPFDSRDYGAVERATCTETVLFRLVSKAGFMDSDNRLEFIK